MELICSATDFLRAWADCLQQLLPSRAFVWQEGRREKRESENEDGREERRHGRKERKRERDVMGYLYTV